MEIVVILILILLNGIFAMSEIAVVSTRRSSLSNEAKHGSKPAQSALKLKEEPNIFLSTVQVGITLIGILTGIYSGDVLASRFTPVLEGIGISDIYSRHIAQICIIAIVTYLTIIFGELVPKRIGLSNSEKIAKLVAKPMIWLSTIATPFVWILSRSTTFIFNLIGIKDKDTKVTEEEIKLMVRQGALEGEVQLVEQEIVERVFSLGDRTVESIMTPKSEISWIEKGMSKDEIRKRISDNPFDKYPVADSTIDNLEGIVYLKDIFTHIDTDNFSLKEILYPADYFYENMKVYLALEKMKNNHIAMAFITDEFGVVSGLVTIKDIMEALVGEIPEVKDEGEIVKRKDGTFLVDGQYSFYDFLNYFQRGELYSRYEYNTLSGLILRELGEIPKTGEEIEWHGFLFEIVDMDGPRIDKILVVPTKQPKQY